MVFICRIKKKSNDGYYYVTSQSAEFETLEIPVDGDVTIGGRFYAAGTNDPTILFFHGNGEIVADYHDVAAMYRAQRINFMPVDYRGYGLSTGTPTITAILSDARATYAFAKQFLRERKYTGRFIVMGRSLGSAAALDSTGRWSAAASAMFLGGQAIGPAIGGIVMTSPAGPEGLSWLALCLGTIALLLAVPVTKYLDRQSRMDCSGAGLDARLGTQPQA